MEELLKHYLDKPVTLKDQAVIQISGYDMDYFEFQSSPWQVLIYRSHKNPVITKVIIVKDKTEFNYTLPGNTIQVSHFLDYYLSLSQLSNQQLSLIMGKLEETSFHLRKQALFYKLAHPENLQLVNILPSELKQAMRDYDLLIKLWKKYSQSTIVKLFNELNIDAQDDFLFLQNLAHKDKS